MASRIRRSVGRALKLLLALALATKALYAQDSGAEVRTAARDLAVQGAEAFDHRDYATALDRFGRAYSLVPAPSISIMQARSLAKMGRIIEALDRYEKTQHMQLAADAPDAFRQAVVDARIESEELWNHVPRLTIHVHVSPAAPNNLAILLDSKQVPGALLDVGRPIDPGPHKVDVSATGYVSETRSITIEPNERVTLDIPLIANSSSTTLSLGVVSSRPQANDRPARDPVASIKPWAWVAVGVGTAGLALSAVTGVVALNKKATLDEQCHPGCPAEAASDISTFRTTRTISYVSLLGGAASLGLGSYILLRSPGEQGYVGATLGPTHAGIWGAF